MSDDGSDALELRYVGRRFDGGRLPTDVLQDLPALRDLLTAITRELWLTDHPWRQRVPTGFYQVLVFDLVSLRGGSAVPQLEWNPTAATLAAPDLTKEIGVLLPKALAVVAGLFDAASGDALPAALPTDQVNALNKFGAALYDGERIELTGQNDKVGNVIYLDPARRARLVTKIHATYESNYNSKGHLETVSLQGWIGVDDPIYGSISFPVPSEIVEHSYNGNLGALVEYSLVLELNSQNYLRRVDKVLDVSVSKKTYSDDMRRLMSRISMLRKLEDGWLDGAGSAISQAATRQARAVLDARPELAERSGLFPTVEGGLMLEFVLNDWDYSIDILHSGRIEFYGVKIDGDDSLDPALYEDLESFLTHIDLILNLNTLSRNTYDRA